MASRRTHKNSDIASRRPTNGLLFVAGTLFVSLWRFLFVDGLRNCEPYLEFTGCVRLGTISQRLDERVSSIFDFGGELIDIFVRLKIKEFVLMFYVSVPVTNGVRTDKLHLASCSSVQNCVHKFPLFRELYGLNS